MLNPAEGPTTVAILGENPVVGNALESLLRSTDFAARFFPEYLPNSTEPFEGARVALILPALSTRRNEALIAGIRSHPATVDLPVIELITTPNGGLARTHPPTVALRSGGAETEHRSRSAARQRFANLDRIPPATVKPHCHLRIPIGRQRFQAMQGVATGLLARQRLWYVWITYTSVYQV